MRDTLDDRPTAPAAGASPFPMERPRLLARAARRAARLYRRARDLPGAVPGLLSREEGEIVARLAAAEARCEAERRAGAAGYRPARHLQILAALLAEAGRARADQPKASGSSALRRAT